MSWNFQVLSDEDYQKMMTLKDNLFNGKEAVKELAEFLVTRNVAPAGSINCKTCKADILLTNILAYQQEKENTSGGGSSEAHRGDDRNLPDDGRRS